MSSPLTIADVRGALSALYLNRNREQANVQVRRLIRQFGGGAERLSDVDPKYFRTLYDAAAGTAGFKPDHPLD